jgi:hypothetical protein
MERDMKEGRGKWERKNLKRRSKGKIRRKLR